MIDIHTHVLPGIDDGSSSMEMSLELLSMAADSGVRAIVATPHCNIPDEYENYVSPGLIDLWNRLLAAKKKAGIEIHLCRGMEIYATTDLPRLLAERKVWTLNGTNYFLMEFGFREDPDFCRLILRQCADLGFRPIIAHPERYYFIQNDPELAYEWCVNGYGLQINKGSLLGRFGKGPQYTAESLLRHGVVACVASDAHNPRQRTTHMKEIQLYLMEEYGEEYARLLLRENPARILTGRDMLGYEPIPFR